MPHHSRRMQPGQHGHHEQQGQYGQQGQHGQQDQPAQPGQPEQQGQHGKPAQHGKLDQSGQQGQPGRRSQSGKPGQPVQHEKPIEVHEPERLEGVTSVMANSPIVIQPLSRVRVHSDGRVSMLQERSRDSRSRSPPRTLENKESRSITPRMSESPLWSKFTSQSQTPSASRGSSPWQLWGGVSEPETSGAETSTPSLRARLNRQYGGGKSRGSALRRSSKSPSTPGRRARARSAQPSDRGSAARCVSESAGHVARRRSAKSSRMRLSPAFGRAISEEHTSAATAGRKGGRGKESAAEALLDALVERVIAEVSSEMNLDADDLPLIYPVTAHTSIFQCQRDRRAGKDISLDAFTYSLMSNSSTGATQGEKDDTVLDVEKSNIHPITRPGGSLAMTFHTQDNLEAAFDESDEILHDAVMEIQQLREPVEVDEYVSMVEASTQAANQLTIHAETQCPGILGDGKGDGPRMIEGEDAATVAIPDMPQIHEEASQRSTLSMACEEPCSRSGEQLQGASGPPDRPRSLTERIRDIVTGRNFWRVVVFLLALLTVAWLSVVAGALASMALCGPFCCAHRPALPLLGSLLFPDPNSVPSNTIRGAF